MGDGAPALSTIPALEIPYIIGTNGKALYALADLDAFAAAREAAQTRRMGGRRRQALPTNTVA
jgi:hypothetical protein